MAQQAMASCMVALDPNAALQKATACTFYQDVFMCYQTDCCNDFFIKLAMQDAMAEAQTKLAGLGVTACTLQCGNDAQHTSSASSLMIGAMMPPAVVAMLLATGSLVSAMLTATAS